MGSQPEADCGRRSASAAGGVFDVGFMVDESDSVFDRFWIIFGSENRIVSLDFDSFLIVFGSVLERKTE